MEWRHPLRLKERHPAYLMHSPSITLGFWYGGSFSNLGYMGGNLEKLDYVPHQSLTLQRLDEICDERGILVPPRSFHVSRGLNFPRLTYDADLINEVSKHLAECDGTKELTLYVTQLDEGATMIQEENVDVGGPSNEANVEKENNEENESDSDSDMWDSEGEPRSINEGDSLPNSDVEATGGETSSTVKNALSVGSVFEDRVAFKEAIRTQSIHERRGVKLIKNDKRRCWAICESDGCQWKCNLNKPGGEDGEYRITTSNLVHSCFPQYRLKNLNAKWISDKFCDKYRLDRDRSSNIFREEIKQQLGVEVSKDQAYRARKMCLRQIEGDPIEQYGQLWNYILELERTNPGTTVEVEYNLDGDATRFSQIYICLGALKEGFASGCRRFIGFDGCHLKSVVGGVLLTAVGIDANHSYYPICYAVVGSETYESWSWFLRLLKRDLEINDAPSFTFMSDKQKGLIGAVDEVFPGVNHRFCVRHLHGNFKTAGFKGPHLKNTLWAAARSLTVGEFNRVMEKMKRLNPKAHAWLQDKPPNQWSQSHFNEDVKCEVLMNNICEGFNKTIVKGREMLIVSMLEWLREYLMDRVHKNHVRAAKWSGRWCPKILKRLNSIIEDSNKCTARRCSTDAFQVKTRSGDQCVVNLADMSCSCREWQLTGIPCVHCASAVRSFMGKPVSDYLNECFSVENYRRIYSTSVNGVSDPTRWPISAKPPLLPPIYKRRTGRPKKKRYKSANEIPPCKRNRVSRKCSKCQERGHTIKNCPQVPPPEQDPDADYVADLSASDANRDPRAIIRARETAVFTTSTPVLDDREGREHSNSSDYLLSEFEGEDNLEDSQSEDF